MGFCGINDITLLLPYNHSSDRILAYLCHSIVYFSKPTSLVQVQYLLLFSLAPGYRVFNVPSSIVIVWLK